MFFLLTVLRDWHFLNNLCFSYDGPTRLTFFCIIHVFSSDGPTRLTFLHNLCFFLRRSYETDIFCIIYVFLATVLRDWHFLHNLCFSYDGPTRLLGYVCIKLFFPMTFFEMMFCFCFNHVFSFKLWAHVTFHRLFFTADLLNFTEVKWWWMVGKGLK